MSKLFKLKEWLTIPEAANHLSFIFQEKITETDVLRLCLDKHLTPSMVFHNIEFARRGEFQPKSANPDDFTEDFKDCVDEEDIFQQIQERNLSNEFATSEESLVFYEQVDTVSGCYDLLMLGGECVWIEKLYFENILNSEGLSSNRSDGGITLLDKKNRTVYILLENIDESYEKYRSLEIPPEGSFLAIRTEALIEFQARLDTTKSYDVKDIDPKTKIKLLNLIKALAQSLIPNLNEIIDNPHKAATQIDLALSRKGIELPISKDALANYLKEANK